MIWICLFCFAAGAVASPTVIALMILTDKPVRGDDFLNDHPRTDL